MRRLVFFVLFSVTTCILIFTLFETQIGEDVSNDNLNGSKLAERYCGSCHLLPSPELLDKPTWELEVLPKMGAYLGIGVSDHLKNRVESGIERMLLDKNIFPKESMISKIQWDSLTAYYLAKAPSRMKVVTSEKIEEGLTYFNPRVLASFQLARVGMVKIDENNAKIYFSDANRLFKLNKDLRMEEEVSINFAAVDLKVDENDYTVTDIGSLKPSDMPRGEVAKYILNGNGERERLQLLKRLRRPVHADFADLNQDGQEDIIVCEFGNILGQLAWYEHNMDRTFTAHVIKAIPGTIKTLVKDFNNDGFLDIVALFSQGNEGISVFYNNGVGDFTEKVLLRFPPSYGSSHFEMLDWDHDGNWDILYTNGDNGDYPPIAKSYHGVRLFINEGDFQFEERYFFQFNGAYGAEAHDYNQDGFMDIAAISYFPDYSQTNFVFLEGQGQYKFKAYTLPEAFMGKWLTLASGDFDGDDDIDIVLGSMIHGPGNVPLEIKQKWNVQSPSLIVLENMLK